MLVLGKRWVIRSPLTQLWLHRLKNSQTAKVKFSSATVNVEADKETKIAVLKLNNRPVNCLSYELLQDSINAIKHLESSNCRAVIITSTIPKVFCAGLDFKEIVKPNRERLIKYFKLFEDFIVTVYSSKLATIAAINGAAPAGGAVLSLATDYRIIGPNGSIGLNEVAIGLPLQSWIIQLCASVGGMRNAELANLTGEIFKPEKALKLGFVDEIATEQDLLVKAQNQAKVFSNLQDQNTWYITKMGGRQPLVDLILNRKLDGGTFLETIEGSTTQNILKAYGEKLKKKK